MSHSRRAARYHLLSHPSVARDIDALTAYGPEAAAAALVAVDDLAHGRVTGKPLGRRRVSGDLTGFARVKFDVPGPGAPRFRLIYAEIDDATRAVLAIGVRDDHAIYRMAVQRIIASDEPSQSEPGGE